ncbi:MAG: ComEC/Rec2 family competence protein [bacterium]
MKNIDLGVITHFDVDHALGIIDLLKEKRIKSLMIPYIYTDNHLSSEVFAIAKKNKIPINIAGDGTRININDIVINILYPPDKPYYYRKNNNSNSIVMRLIYHNFSILLTGDIEREGEKKLLEKNYNLESIILKLAHHGSKTSSTQEFIKKSNPREAVISVGKNNYGHPDPEVLERIEKMGIRCWITEEKGAVIIKTNGQEYSIKSFMEN